MKEKWCCDCKYYYSLSMCHMCKNKDKFEDKKTDTEWWRDEEPSTSIGGYYSDRTGHAGYTYTNR